MTVDSALEMFKAAGDQFESRLAQRAVMADFAQANWPHLYQTARNFFGVGLVGVIVSIFLPEDYRMVAMAASTAIAGVGMGMTYVLHLLGESIANSAEDEEDEVDQDEHQGEVPHLSEGVEGGHHSDEQAQEGH